MALFIAGLLVLAWFVARTHRKRKQLVSGGAINAAAWRLANRRRFRLGPRRWRLDTNGENTL